MKKYSSLLIGSLSLFSCQAQESSAAVVAQQKKSYEELRRELDQLLAQKEAFLKAHDVNTKLPPLLQNLAALATANEANKPLMQKELGVLASFYLKGLSTENIQKLQALIGSYRNLKRDLNAYPEEKNRQRKTLELLFI